MILSSVEVKKFLKLDLQPIRIGDDGRLYFTELPEGYKPAQSSNDEELKDKSHWTEWRTSNYEFFKSRLGGGLSKDLVLLDIGAGAGEFRELFTGFQYIGIDFWPHPDVRIVADITKQLPFQDGSCDIIILSNVLEHTPEPEVIIQECARILKVGGLLLGVVPFLTKIHQEPYDFLRYTNFMLERMMKGSALKNIEVLPLGKPLDIYLASLRALFKQLANGNLNFFERKLANFVRKLMVLTIWLFGRLFKKAKLSYKFTQGFGFQASK
ncbi:MAG: class I SAM-dependent methyltransferase [Patescibacteria group bacterium]